MARDKEEFVYDRLRVLIERAEAGDAHSQYSLGLVYRDGHPLVKSDKRKMLELYKAAAKGGDADAMIELGDIYENGRDVRQDIDRAYDLYWWAMYDGNDKQRAKAEENMSRMLGAPVRFDVQQGDAFTYTPQGEASILERPKGPI